MQIFLIGFMGSGKTTIGQILANILEVNYLDMDVQIEEQEGMSVADIFKQKGEPYFRKVEQNLLLSLEDYSGIIATGGGVVLDEMNRDFLKNRNRVVYLKAQYVEIMRRLEQEKDSRPLLQFKESAYVSDLLQARLPSYIACSTHSILTDGQPPEDIARAIIRMTGVQT